MSKWTLITVTQPLAKWYGELRCQRGGRRLDVGEQIWRRRFGSLPGKKPQHYCKGCFKKLSEEVRMHGKGT